MVVNHVGKVTRTNTSLVFQLVGAAIFVSSGESIFSNILISSLRKTVPAVEVLSGIVACYMDGLSAAFLLSAILACCASLVSFFAPWVSIKGKTGMVAAV